MSKLIFNYKTMKYDLKNALKLAEASKLAYESQRMIKAHTKVKWGFDEFRFFDKCDTQAFMIANDDGIILSFRGTESIRRK